MTDRGIVLAWLLALTIGLGAQPAQSRLMGVVLDESGGALPGVTVTIRAGTAPPMSVFTDGNGRYLTASIAPGSYTITFVLSGFETRTANNIEVRSGDTVVLDQKLPLEKLTERVEVTAPAPAPPAPRVRPVTPRPVAKPVDKEILASVCGPRQAPEYSLAIGKIVSHRDSDRQLLGPGDVVRIDVGDKQGLTAGQNFVVRRRFQTGDLAASKKLSTFAEQTAGLIQILDTQADSSSALVVYACGELFAGDSVERYVPQPAFFSVTAGTPRFDDAARVTAGESGREVSAPGQMVVIDRGIMQNAQRGQLVTFFRLPSGIDGPPAPHADGVIVAVRADSATVRIERSTDAVLVGDLVALHR